VTSDDESPDSPVAAPAVTDCVTSDDESPDSPVAAPASDTSPETDRNC